MAGGLRNPTSSFPKMVLSWSWSASSALWTALTRSFSCFTGRLRRRSGSARRSSSRRRNTPEKPTFHDWTRQVLAG